MDTIIRRSLKQQVQCQLPSARDCTRLAAACRAPAPRRPRTCCRVRAAASAAPEAAAAPAPAPLQPAPRPDPTASSALQPGLEDREPDLDVTVRPVRGLLELRQVARLRAEAYYADDRSRFAESFKRQFASQEVDSLQHRTVPRNGRAQQCDCLVALDTSGLVVGCIDIRVPQTATGMATSGVPPGEPSGAYILNVVVSEHVRGRGVGRRLMRAAMARAVRVWGATRLFTHVEAGNEVASVLYRSCGFSEHSDSAAYDGTSTLGRLLLLVVDGSCVDTSVPSGGDPLPSAA